NRRLGRGVTINPNPDLHYKVALDFTFLEEPWGIELTAPGVIDVVTAGHFHDQCVFFAFNCAVSVRIGWSLPSRNEQLRLRSWSSQSNASQQQSGESKKGAIHCVHLPKDNGPARVKHKRRMI